MSNKLSPRRTGKMRSQLCERTSSPSGGAYKAQEQKIMLKLNPSAIKLGHFNSALQAFLAKYRNNRVSVKYMEPGSGTVRTTV